MPTSVTPDVEVAVIGAGFSGIGVGIALDEAGFHDYALLEEGTGVGGTWNWNRYPGVAVDIPSFSYQYSFEQRNSWSRVYAPGRELRDYADHCADKYGVRDKVRFETKVESATFDEEKGVWRLAISGGDEIVARYVVGASGPLSQPKMPDIAGLDDFAGDWVHTSRWDHDLELEGKRVGIIGTGASAVQIIPEIAPAVDQLTVFQRTPIWCLPKPDAALPGRLRWAMGKLPGVMGLTRAASQAYVEFTFPLTAHFHKLMPLAKVFEKSGRSYMASQIDDPQMREKLIPKYALGCKRPSFHNSYLKTYNRENVSLETTGIDRITETGIRMKDGSEHEFDVIILATGFKVFEPDDNALSYDIIGREGVVLEQWWTENRLQAYQGCTVPGFPNMFQIIGPYGYNGSSFFKLIESQSAHIAKLLKTARKRGNPTVEVTAEANERYWKKMLGRRDMQVFWQPSCATANSYYFDPNGDVPFRPSPTIEVDWMATHFDLDDYTFTPAGDREKVAA